MKESMSEKLKRLSNDETAITIEEFKEKSGVGGAAIYDIFDSYIELCSMAGLKCQYRVLSRKIKNRNDFDDNADCYVYVIAFEQKEIGEIFYVGKSHDLFRRLSVHQRPWTSTCNLPRKNSKGYTVLDIPKEEEIHFTRIVEIESIYKNEDENTEEFQNRIKFIERQKWLTTAIEKGEKTFGGR